MSRQTTVSVLIAAHNAAGFIERAILSALNQSLPPLEVIVVDDASSDATCAVVAAIAASDPRVRMVSLSCNGGPSVARNRAIEEASGDWLAILDADDAYHPDRLLALTQLGEQTGAAIVTDDVLLYDAVAGQVVGRGLSQPPADGWFGIDLRGFVQHNCGTGPGVDWGLFKPVIRRTALQRTGIRYRTDLRHGEDFQFIAELLLAGERYVCATAAYYLYTERHGAVSRVASRMSRTRIDYATQATQALRLAADPRLAGDAATRRMLKRRATGMHRLAQWHMALASLRERRIAALAASLVRQPGIVLAIGQALVRRARRAVRGPGAAASGFANDCRSVPAVRAGTQRNARDCSRPSAASETL